MWHSNILFKRNPLVTQTEETVDPYQILINCLSLFSNMIEYIFKLFAGEQKRARRLILTSVVNGTFSVEPA